jgi:glycine cleavage system H protein
MLTASSMPKQVRAFVTSFLARPRWFVNSSDVVYHPPWLLFLCRRISHALYYLVEKHVWVRVLEDGKTQLGLTPVAYKMLRNSIVAISVKSTLLGQRVTKGKSLAMVESLKYIGPLSAPFDGVFVRGNDRLASDPDLAVADPYGEGWIAEMLPADWGAACQELLFGPAALAAYAALLDAQNIGQE